MADTKNASSSSLEALDAPAEIRTRISELRDDLDRAAGAPLRGLIFYEGLYFMAGWRAPAQAIASIRYRNSPARVRRAMP